MSLQLCRRAGALLCVSVFLCWLAGVPAAARPFAQEQRQAAEPVALGLGKPIQRALALGERHTYLIKLEAGQFVKFELWQRDTIIEVTIYSPTGERLFQRFRTGVQKPQGRLHVPKLVIDHAGVYRVELTPVSYQQTAGQYQFTWVEQRPANADDRALQEAQKVLDEAGAMQGRYSSGTAADRKLLREEKEFDRMIKLGEHSLAVFQRLLPPDEGNIGNLAIILTNLYTLRGYYGDRERIEQVREIAAINREHMLGPYDYQVALLYQLLAKEDNPVLAERWFRMAVAAAEGMEFDQAFLADILSDLASNLRELGETARANELFKRVALMVERLLAEPDSCQAESGCHGKIVVALVNLGGDLLEQGDLAGAERHLRRAWSLFQNPVVQSGGYGRKPELLLRLGMLYQQKGDYAQAESFFRQLIALGEDGEPPVQQGNVRRQLGNLFLAKGAYQPAAEAFRQARASLEKTGQSPALARLMRDWRRLHLATGQLEAALAIQQQAVEITEADLSRLLVAGTEWEKLKLLALARDETNETLTLHAKYAPHSAAALRLAFTTWLQRKARVQDEMSLTVWLLRNSLSKELVPLFNDLLNKQSQLARLATALHVEKDQAAQVAQLTQELEQLQRTLSERSREYRVQTQPVTLEAVQQALPARAALVDFARFEPFDEQAQRPLPARYVAYILLPEGPPRWVDLGAAHEIEPLVEAWRKALDLNHETSAGQASPDVRKLARQVDALVMQPVRAQLGNLRQVFLAPDGALNLMSFAALIDERGRYLVEDYLFIYLTSGRDLLRLQTKHESKADVLVFAAPDYDDGSGAVAAPLVAVADDGRGGRVSRGVATVGRFEPLPSAGAEAQAIKLLWPRAQLFLDKQATESALKQVHRPLLLHIATHGVFLEDQKKEGSVENPLLRAWLALAGANQRKSGADDKEDGILTAYEAAALDLWGTKLVVLSACETGVGEVRNGEGVYGLRRALVLAGAEAQLTSLWKVNDNVTKDLMSAYYGKLRAGWGAPKRCGRCNCNCPPPVSTVWPGLGGV